MSSSLPGTLPAARVILLTGPSGSGKSSLAARTGLPVLHLDDFYKEHDDPTLPQLPHGAGTDWDSALSWDADAAVAAIGTLCATGSASVPEYDIASSSITGEIHVELTGSPVFVAEGIFAADITDRCRDLGLLADTLCLRGRPAVTAWRRFRRDLAEGRKSVTVLVRRGWRLMRGERAIVARQTALGAYPCGQDEALRRITALPRRPSAPRRSDRPADIPVDA
ncbi:ATP-binding protein [Streptomyces sp. SPB162]|uniref:uridine kinase family protein n=1 Tax=Streptomyces sp. SPB162 TaxID=2940560 RepID=UPI002406E8D1|nr:ATP-binding protein [Streptomyces sp. SPB162]MDF9815230.1 uridine kinase [Streptomyces sp. SPB162]